MQNNRIPLLFSHMWNCEKLVLTTFYCTPLGSPLHMHNLHISSLINRCKETLGVWASFVSSFTTSIGPCYSICSIFISSSARYMCNFLNTFPAFQHSLQWKHSPCSFRSIILSILHILNIIGGRLSCTFSMCMVRLSDFSCIIEFNMLIRASSNPISPRPRLQPLCLLLHYLCQFKNP